MDAALLEKAEKLCVLSASLESVYPYQILDAIRSLLRVVNSYYSNQIESEGTHPFDIEKASHKIFSGDLKQQQLQKLSLVHIEVQQWIETLFKAEGDEIVFKRDFIRDIHRKFYSHEDMKPFLNIHNKLPSGKEEIIKMIPGEFRDRRVVVASHLAPEDTDIQTLFNLYESSYKIPPHSIKAKKVLYALASHHRLTWIHPFLDGNGRTSRLVLDGIFAGIHLQGYGLWNISRGLARRSEDYKNYLALADKPREGDLDGRGALSLKNFKLYMHFMLDVAIDQVEYMSKALQLPTLSQRIVNYVIFTQEHMYDVDPLPKYSEILLKELLMVGDMPRGSVAPLIHASDRTASMLIKKLLERDFLDSDTPKGDIRLKFNTHFASAIFPDLISRK
jgi:Fic family protein